jgi:hypothetical protein
MPLIDLIYFIIKAIKQFWLESNPRENLVEESY